MTSLLPVTPAVLHGAVDDLKRRNAGQKPITNYFFQDLNGVANLRMLELEKSLCFFYDEWDFARFYFYAFDVANLEEELRKITWPPITVGEWISNAGSGPLDGFFANLGFHLHAVYERIKYTNIRREHSNAHLKLADPKDRDAIHAILFRVFDKYADHIMSLGELGEMIAEDQVILSSDAGGSIDGLVILPITGRNCNFNFLYHGGGALNLSLLLGNFYGVLTERGVQSGFSWVRRTRPMVLKLHESCGWQKDGLADYIYLR